MTAEVSIDFDRIERGLRGNAARAVQATLSWTEDRAKHYAPVREAFDKSQDSRRPGDHLAHERGLVIRHDSDADRDRFMTNFKRSRRKERQVVVKEPFHAGAYIGRQRRGGVADPAGEQSSRRFGTANSYFPIFRLGREVATGLDSFRRVRQRGGRAQLLTDPQGRQTFGLEPQVVLRGQRGMNQTLRATTNGYGYAEASADNRLNKRGRYELRFAARDDIDPVTERATGTKSFRRAATYRGASGVETIGGRLRGEIYATQVRATASEISGEVVSPTEYSVYQEYGTVHHRAQPFMRPALYDARQVLHDQTVKAMASGIG